MHVGASRVANGAVVCTAMDSSVAEMGFSTTPINSHKLKTLPSPALTNADLILPNEVLNHQTSSPPRASRPPSPSYLYKQRRKRGDPSLSAQQNQQKYGQGRMSRKRTPRRYSSELDDPSAQGDGTSKHTQYSPESAQASSPTTGSVNVAQRRSPSSQHDFTTAKHSDRPLSTGSSITASSLDGLSWYKAGDEDEDESDYGTMDGEDDGNTTPTRSTFLESPPRKRGIVSQTSQEDEEAYTELSRRAEAILANAKRRLNVSGSQYTS